MKVDCDVSLRNIIIYILAFPYVSKTSIRISRQPRYTYKYRIQLNSDEMITEYRGDTMNSYSTTINEFLRLFGDDKNNPKVLKINSSKRNNGKFMTRDCYSEWEECILDNYSHFEKILPEEAMEFIKVNHTIGNFIPVPFQSVNVSFNSPRGTGKTKDYWDLTLLNIYNWYESKDDLYLTNIVNSKENCELCKIWLNIFPSWDVFLEQNYLEDFVQEKNNNGSYGKPMELWDGHFSKQDKLPFAEDEYIQFFNRTTKLIMARGKKIANIVNNRLTDDKVISNLKCMLEDEIWN